MAGQSWRSFGRVGLFAAAVLLRGSGAQAEDALPPALEAELDGGSLSTVVRLRWEIARGVSFLGRLREARERGYEPSRTLFQLVEGPLAKVVATLPFPEDRVLDVWGVMTAFRATEPNRVFVKTRLEAPEMRTALAAHGWTALEGRYQGVYRLSEGPDEAAVLARILAAASPEKREEIREFVAATSDRVRVLDDGWLEFLGRSFERVLERPFARPGTARGKRRPFPEGGLFEPGKRDYLVMSIPSAARKWAWQRCVASDAEPPLETLDLAAASAEELQGRILALETRDQEVVMESVCDLSVAFTEADGSVNARVRSACPCEESAEVTAAMLGGFLTLLRLDVVPASLGLARDLGASRVDRFGEEVVAEVNLGGGGLVEALESDLALHERLAPLRRAFAERVPPPEPPPPY